MSKRFCIAIVVTLVVLLVLSYLPIHGEAKVYDTVLRLHVLANSDSEEDQALKLKVRDGVLAVTAPMGSLEMALPISCPGSPDRPLRTAITAVS